MNKIQWGVLAKTLKRLFAFSLALFVLFPPFTLQILPSLAIDDKGITVEVIASRKYNPINKPNKPNTLTLDNEIALVLDDGKKEVVSDNDKDAINRVSTNYLTIKYSLSKDRLYFYKDAKKIKEISLKGKSFNVKDFVKNLEKKYKQGQLIYFATHNLPLSEKRIKNNYEEYKKTNHHTHYAISSSDLALNLDAKNVNGTGTLFATNSVTEPTWADLSGNGNNGTLTNISLSSAPTSGWTGDGSVANPSALYFDGINDYVNIGDRPSVKLTTGISGTAWVNIPSAPGGGEYLIFAKRTAYYFDIVSSGQIRVYTYNTTGTWFPSISSIPINTWAHVAFTYNGANLKLFINGVLDTSEARTGNIQNSTQSLTIGTSINESGRYFKGRMANVRIYNRGLTDAEISSIYSSEAPDYNVCIPPTNPTISSVTINGLPQAVSSSYTITNDQALNITASSVGSYSGSQITLSCNTTAGNFSSFSGANTFGRLDFTPGAVHVGMTYNYTIMATNNCGINSASDLSVAVSVICGSDSGCDNGQSCNVQTGGCDTRCIYGSNLFSMDMLCSPALIPPPPPSAPSVSLVQTPVPVSTPSATPTPIVNSTPIPQPTAAPVANTTPQQGTAIIQPPTVNALPPSVPSNTIPQTQPNTFTQTQVEEINMLVQSSMVIDLSLIKNIPTDKLPAVKPDSDTSYIDISKIK